MRQIREDDERELNLKERMNATENFFVTVQLKLSSKQEVTNQKIVSQFFKNTLCSKLIDQFQIL